LPQLIEISSFKMFLVKAVLTRRMKKSLHVQGLGRYPSDKMVEILEEDLRNLSLVLGQKRFWFGEEPTEIDCTLFGFLAQTVWSMPGSPYEKLVKSKAEFDVTPAV